MAKFSELGLHEDLIEAISWMGFENATPIQEKRFLRFLKEPILLRAPRQAQEKQLHSYFLFLIS